VSPLCGPAPWALHYAGYLPKQAWRGSIGCCHTPLLPQPPRHIASVVKLQHATPQQPAESIEHEPTSQPSQDAHFRSVFMAMWSASLMALHARHKGRNAVKQAWPRGIVA
jgi:hypothetical protein